MRHRRNSEEMDSGGSVIVGGGDGSFVSGERLKQADVPVETLLGTANGALTGAMFSGLVSAAVTFAREGKGPRLIENIFKNVTGTHLVSVLAGTAAFAALGGLIRYSRATKHNEWSERHYAFMENKARQESHLERAERGRYDDGEKSPVR